MTAQVSGPEPPPRVAVFDFDETLVHENSLVMLYREMAHTPLWWTALRGACRKDRALLGLHKAVKAQMYDAMLRGRAVEELATFGERLAPRLSVITPVLAELEAHRAAGATLVVASASLEVVVAEILRLKGISVDHVLGSVPASLGGLCDGGLISGECVGTAKAERLAAALHNIAPGGRTRHRLRQPAGRPSDPGTRRRRLGGPRRRTTSLRRCRCRDPTPADSRRMFVNDGTLYCREYPS